MNEWERAIGDAFEASVYDALAAELAGNRLGIAPKSARIHRKKGYNSKDRGADIVTDVSVEVFLPDRERPSLIWVFECKAYSGTVPVDDIEEFHAKLQQIGEDNTKGTVVTTAALQRGALAYARSKGIGLIRLLPDGQVQHLVEFLTAQSGARSVEVNWSEFEPALTNPNHRSRRHFFAVADGYWFGSWYSLIRHVVSPADAA